MNRPALGSFPSATWAETVQNGLLKVAPKGTPHLFTQMCGSCANEGALKAAFMAYRARERKAANNEDFTPEEVSLPPSSHLQFHAYTLFADDFMHEESGARHARSGRLVIHVRFPRPSLRLPFPDAQ